MRNVAAILAWEITPPFYYWMGVIGGAVGLFLGIGTVVGAPTGMAWSLLGLAFSALGHLYLLEKLERWAKAQKASRIACTTLLGSVTVLSSLTLSVPWLLLAGVPG